MTKENKVCLAFSRDSLVRLGALCLPPQPAESEVSAQTGVPGCPWTSPEGTTPFCFRSLNFNTMESVINPVSMSLSDTLCMVCKTIAGDVVYSGVISLTQGLLGQAF